MRLDKFFTATGTLTRSEAQRAVRAKRVCVNGTAAKKADMNIDPEIDKITLDGEMVGFFFTYFYCDFAMVDYFAIHKDYRNRGIGREAIRLLSELYADKRVFLEIEDPESSEMAQRRLCFYNRCGFVQTGTRVNLFSVDMELLTLGEFDVSFEEYFELYVSMLGKIRAKRNVLPRK